MGHLYAFLSPVELALSLSILLPLLLSFLPCVPFRDSIYEGSKLPKAFFVIDYVYLELDSVRALGPSAGAVHFTQFQLNPIRRIGFGRSGMSLGFTI